MSALRTMLIFVVMTLAVPAARACEVCFGDPNDPQTKGMNGAIITLMIITYLTLAGLFVMFLFAWRRARAKRLAAPIETEGGLA